MKLIAKAHFMGLWSIFMLTGLSVVLFSALSSAVTIGENYRGGIVFYIDVSGQHGLVASKTDMRGHFSGEGEGYFTWYDAKAACNTLVNNGYSDWLIPNRWQLNQLYLHNDDVGGFAGDGYWCSSEFSADRSWVQDFSNGYQIQYNKDGKWRVRPIRAF